MSNSGTTGVLFVCLGNICRSPLAKFIFLDLATKAGTAERFKVDSCGTSSYHAGDDADPRTLAVARARGLTCTHCARPLRVTDFADFDYLIAMDLKNRADMLRLGAPPERVHLLRSFDPALAGQNDDALIVPDPYYGGPDGFDRMYDMIDAACRGLLSRLPTRQR